MDVTSRRLAALFTLGLLAFFPPGIGAFNLQRTVLGIPLLPFYVFAVWAVFVVAAWLVVRRGRR